MYTVAGFTGLRQGELRALRWKHVRFADRTIVVVAGISAGEESGTKSGKWRAVPLAREPFVALDELSRREWFTSADDYVFCGPPGDPLDDSALRRRFDRRARCRRPPAAAVPSSSTHVRDPRDPRTRSGDRASVRRAGRRIVERLGVGRLAPAEVFGCGEACDNDRDQVGREQRPASRLPESEHRRDGGHREDDREPRVERSRFCSEPLEVPGKQRGA